MWLQFTYSKWNLKVIHETCIILPMSPFASLVNSIVYLLKVEQLLILTKPDVLKPFLDASLKHIYVYLWFCLCLFFVL